MQVKQISVFIENRTGRLLEVTRILGKGDINIRALSLADTSEFGILRLIVNKPDTALDLLRNAGFTVNETEVVAVEVPDRPGGLAEVLGIFSEASLNIEYMYAFVEKMTDHAVMIFRFENIPEAIRLLKDKNVRILKNEDVITL